MKNKFIILLFLFILSSCSDIFPAGEKFVITKVESPSRGTYKYILSSVEGRAMFFMESENIYQIDDTLSLRLNCE